MSKIFSLSSLIPEPLTFTDDGYGGDGKRYDVLTPDLFSAADLSAMGRLRSEMPALLASTDDAAVEQIVQLADQMIALLIPTLPPVRRLSLPLAAKLAVVQWWTGEVQHQGEVVATTKRGRPRKAARARRVSSPDLSPPTTSTPSA